MTLALLIPLSLAMGVAGVAAFLWALRHNQFDDLDGASWRVLLGEAEGEQEGGARIPPRIAPRPDTAPPPSQAAPDCSPPQPGS